MEVKCTNKNCFHRWKYKGSHRNKYISCPSCHFRIMLRKALIGRNVKNNDVAVKSPMKSFFRSPTIEEKPRVNPLLPRLIGDMDMFDGKVPRREDLPKLPE